MATTDTKMPRQARSNSDVDGGWAWVILMTSFLSLMMVCGALYSVSVFNVIFLEVFETSKAQTSFVGSVLIGLIAFMGKFKVTAQPFRYLSRFLLISDLFLC